MSEKTNFLEFIKGKFVHIRKRVKQCDFLAFSIFISQRILLLTLLFSVFLSECQKKDSFAIIDRGKVCTYSQTCKKCTIRVMPSNLTVCVSQFSHVNWMQFTLVKRCFYCFSALELTFSENQKTEFFQFVEIIHFCLDVHGLLL